MIDPSELHQIYCDLRALGALLAELATTIDRLLPEAMASGISLLVEEPDIQTFR
jgi:hypothetical protein